MKQIYTTTLRLNLENEADRRAWEHLQSLDRREYRSVSKAVVSAVNAYFDRSKQLADDPYLETREKEDAFLSRIEDTISRSLQSCTPVSLAGQYVPLSSMRRCLRRTNCPGRHRTG